MKELLNGFVKKYFDYDITDSYLVQKDDGTWHTKHIRRYRLRRRKR